MLSSYSVKRPYTVVVAVVIVILLGIISFMNMTTDLLPSIDLPYVVCMTTYPGASPEEVELVVTDPLEQALATTTNVENISSSSAENTSVIFIEFAQGANMDSVLVEMNATIDLVESAWGDREIRSPMLIKMNPDAIPIMAVAVDAEGMGTREVTVLTDEKLTPALERLEGVASVTERGLIEESFEFVIEPDKVARINDKVQDLIDKKLQDARDELEEARNEIESGRRALSETGTEQGAAVTAAQSQITSGKIQMAQAETELSVARMQIEQMAAMASQTMSQLRPQLNELLAQRSELDATISELEAARDEIEQGKTQAGEAKGQIEEAKAQVEQTKADMEQAGMEVPAELDEQLAELDSQLAQIDDTLTELEQNGQAVDEGLAEATAGREQLASGVSQLEASLEQAEASYAEAQSRLSQLEGAGAEISASRAQIEQSESQVQQGTGALASGLAEATARLAAAQAAMAGGEEQIDAQEDAAKDQADMTALITPAMVSQAISAQNFAMPAGYVNEDGQDWLVRVGDELESVEELESLVLFNPGIEGMDPVTASDVGDVRRVDNSDETYAVINGSDGIVLLIQKQSTYSTTQVCADVREAISRVERENPGLHVTSLMDQGEEIDIVIDNIMQNLLYGAVLAIIVLFVFLRSLRPTLTVAVSIPISVVFALVLMYFSGVTLNLISMAGLALGVGMLVDNSIVVIENTYRLRSLGASPKEAAIEGARQVAGAITASTITTICVFLPIVFVEGISRQLFSDMGLTIAYSLIASLIVALTLVPAMSQALLERPPKAEPKFFDRIRSVYGRSLDWCLRHKAAILLPVLALFVWAVLHVFSIGMEFMPTMDSPELSLTMQMPQGSTFQETVDMSDELLSRVKEIPEVETYGAISGNIASMVMSGSTSSSGGMVTIYIDLKGDRTRTSTQIADEIRRKATGLDCEVSVSAGTMDMSAYTGSGIEVRVEGNDMDAMREAARDVADLLGETPGAIDIDNGLQQTTKEIRIRVDKDKAIEYGLMTAQVYQAVSGAISTGISAGSLAMDGSDIPILVLDEDSTTLTPSQIGDIELEGTVGQEKKACKLKDIAEISEGEGLGTISRVNQVRAITVTAGVDGQHNVSLVTREFSSKLDMYPVPEGVTVRVEGENTTIVDALDDLLYMLAVAVTLIYLIMVAQFQSLKSPFIVMFTIPLAYTGGLVALFMAGYELSVIAMLGFLILSGIIVNNGIVLVDCINRNRLAGMDGRAAIVDAGTTRMRPVLMTALTTILGLVTLALGIGMGAEMLQPMAAVTIGGLAYGTILTLYVVPCLYALFNRPGKKDRLAPAETAEESGADAPGEGPQT